MDAITSTCVYTQHMTTTEKETAMAKSFTLNIPKRFFEDHAERDLVNSSGERSAYILKETKTRYVVWLSEADAEELLSDADHYSTEWVYMDRDFFGLGMSAKATKKTVYEQMIAQGHVFSESEIRGSRLHRL